MTLSRGLSSASPSPSVQWGLGWLEVSQGSLIPAPLGWGQRFPVFGDFKAFDSQKPSALTPACTLPCLSFPGQFPQRPGTQL